MRLLVFIGLVLLLCSSAFAFTNAYNDWTTPYIYSTYYPYSWIDLSTTDPGNWVGGVGRTVFSVEYDSVNNVVWTGIGVGRLGYYNVSNGTWVDLSATDPGNWVSTNNVYLINYDSVKNVVWTGLHGGKFGYYNVSNGTWVDLSATDPGDWVSTSPVQSVNYDSVNNVVWTGLHGGKFGYYNVSNGTWVDLSANDPGNWVSTSIIYSVNYDSVNNVVWTGAEVGKLGVFNLTPNDLNLSCDCEPEASTTVTITATDLWGLSLIQAFNVSINSTTYQTTNSTIYLDGFLNTGSYTIEITAENYFSREFTLDTDADALFNGELLKQTYNSVVLIAFDSETNETIEHIKANITGNDYITANFSAYAKYYYSQNYTDYDIYELAPIIYLTPEPVSEGGVVNVDITLGFGKEVAVILAMIALIGFIFYTSFAVRRDKDSYLHRAFARVWFMFVVIPLNYLAYVVMEFTRGEIYGPAFSTLFNIVFIGSILFIMIMFILLFTKGTSELVQNQVDAARKIFK
jgi:hypothetical protein